MFTTRRKGIIALLCAVFAAALIACAISLAPSASRTAPVYAAEGDLQVTQIVDSNDSSTTYATVEKAVAAGIKFIIDTDEPGVYNGYTSLYDAMWNDFKANDTLILLQDCETAYIQLPNGSTIDLNDHDLTYTGTSTIIFSGNSSRTATITDNSVSGSERGGTLNITGERDGAKSVFEIGATLNVSNINIDSTGCVFYPRGSTAKLNITNCDITTTGIFCVATNAGDQAYYGVTINIAGSSLTAAAEDYDDCAVMMNVSGLLNIENSVITGDRQGLFVRAGDVTVVNSEIVLTGNWAAQEVNDENAYHNEDWQSGNEAPSAAIVAGNRNGTYFADANVTIENSTITAPKEVVAIYVDATSAPQGTAETSYSSDVSISGAETSVTGSIVNNATDGDGKSIEIAVTGGTFTADVAEYIPEGTILTQDESGKIVEDESSVNSAVAEAGGVKYTTLQGAINAAADGAVVTMLAGAEEDITIAEGQDITLDLNGNTLTNESDHTITNSGTLVIDDIAGGGRVTNSTAGKAAVYNAVEATVTLNGGTYTRGTANEYYVIQNQGTMTINDGVTMLQPSDSSSGLTSGWYTVPDGWDTRANLTINGGVFASNGITVKNDEVSNLTITGGTFDVVDGYVADQSVQNWTYATIEGGTFNGNVISWAYTSGSTVVRGDLDITGGTFNGNIDALYYTGSSSEPDEKENVDISGGAFANAFDESFVAEGSVFYPAEDGTYKVVTEEEFETVTDNAGVALMNGVVYDSLADAVDAAPTDGTQVTITLIDTDGDGIVTGSGVKVVEDKNIVIDFDGLTYDVTNPTVGSPGTETNGFQLLKGSTVKMMNGTLVSDTAKILIQNYCDLTVDDMTLDMSDCAQVQYVISNNFGNTVITGDTTIVAAPNQVAFDIYYGLGATYYDGVSVTFDENFTGSVTGKVEYGASAGGAGQEGWLDKTKLTIENGTFDIDLFVHSNYTEMTEEEADEATITISGGKFTTKFSDSYLADGYALSEYNGYYIPISSSTDGTLLEEIAQLRQEIDEAIAAINGELEGGDAATLADAVTALIGKMNELEDKIAELDENMVTDADLQALRNSITVAYNAAVSRVRAELSAQISDLRDSMAEMGDVSGQLDELKAAYEAADALLSAEIDDLRAELTEADAELVAELDAAISELESTYKAADDAIWNAIYALRDADSGMTTALWVIGVIAVLALCAGVAGVAFAIVRTKRS